MSGKDKIAVIGTGGTFAMHARHAFDWIEYGESGIIHPIESLIDQLGELAPDAEILPIPFRALGSTGIVPQDWLELSQLITKTAQDNPDLTGFIVTHGTATLEEAAYFLDLALPRGLNVVVTGAQRPSNTSGSDVAANLRAAIAVARNPRTSEAGVVVVLNNTVFSARDVTKSSSFDLAAFEAVEYGPLATIHADTSVHWRRLPARRDSGFAPDIMAITQLPRVDIAMSYAGADSCVIEAFIAAGAKAIISAGLLPGRPTNKELVALRAAAATGVLVVQSTRSTRGYVAVQKFLTDGNVLAGGDLSAQKVRILVMLALAAGYPREQLQDLILAS